MRERPTAGEEPRWRRRARSDARGGLKYGLWCCSVVVLKAVFASEQSVGLWLGVAGISGFYLAFGALTGALWGVARPLRTTAIRAILIGTGVALIPASVLVATVGFFTDRWAGMPMWKYPLGVLTISLLLGGWYGIVDYSAGRYFQKQLGFEDDWEDKADDVR